MKPEIYKDELADEIYDIIKNNELKTILEIGCSFGGGSTFYITSSIIENNKETKFYGIEFNQDLFSLLIEKYKDLSFCKFYNVSSVNYLEFLSDEYIKFYCKNNEADADLILGWKRFDYEYLNKTKLQQDGIELIKKENDIKYFDFVLLDGSPYAGYSEFNKIYGANWIILDDINDIKNRDVYFILKNDKSYRPYKENHKLRNGYAIFKKNK